MANSETSLCRDRLSKYCKGYGVDIGYGGDPIVKHAITIDMHKPYTNLGNHPLNLGGDARNLYWFKDGVLDFVYSSHLLEDFPKEETKSVIKEWLRVIKPGGKLVLYLPHEMRYREHCKKTGQPYNYGHKIEEMSADYIEQIVKTIPGTKIIHKNPKADIYSFEVVVERLY